MTPSNELFLLIKSMTGPEKGYFKKHSAIHVLHGENIYVKLFDAIDSLDEYDEEKIKKLFRKESFIEHFAVIKNYLFKQICECLTYYNTETRVRFKIRELINTAEVLFEKNLFKSYYKLLERAEKLACENEENTLTSEILILQKKVVATEEDVNMSEKKFKEIVQNEKALAKKIEYDILIQNISSEMPLLIRKTGMPDNPKARQEYKTLFKKMAASYNEKISSKKNTIRYYTLNFHYYLNAVRDYKNAYATSSKLIKLFNTDKNLTNNNLSQYIQALNNHMLACELLRKNTERELTIENLKKIPNTYSLAKNEFIAARIFETISAAEMMHIRSTNDYSKANEVLKYFEDNEKKYRPRINKNRLLLRYYTVAGINANMGLYKVCNKWLNKILREDEKHYGSWLYSAVRSLQLIAHYENGNYELVNYLKKSGYRFHQKKDKLYRFQKVFFNFFNDKLLNTGSDMDKIKLFIKLKTQLTELKNNPEEKFIFDLFDYSAWAESKIQRKSMLDILKE